MRRTIIVLFAAAVAGASFYLGGVVGFAEGQAVQLGRQAPFEASWITATLLSLREGRSEEAIAILESNLDSLLITHGVDSLLETPRFERPGLDPTLGHRLLEPVAEYRLQNPPVTRDPEALHTLQGIVNCLRKAPFEAPDEAIQNYLRVCYADAWSRAA